MTTVTTTGHAILWFAPGSTELADEWARESVAQAISRARNIPEHRIEIETREDSSDAREPGLAVRRLDVLRTEFVKGGIPEDRLELHARSEDEMPGEDWARRAEIRTFARVPSLSHDGGEPLLSFTEINLLDRARLAVVIDKDVARIEELNSQYPPAKWKRIFGRESLGEWVKAGARHALYDGKFRMREGPLTMAEAFDYAVDDLWSAMVVERLLFGREPAGAVDEFRRDLIALESKAFASPHPLRFLRGAILDFTEAWMVISLATEQMLELLVQRFDYVSRPASFVEGEVGSAVVRNYTAANYGDRAGYGWWEIYVEGVHGRVNWLRAALEQNTGQTDESILRGWEELHAEARANALECPIDAELAPLDWRKVRIRKSQA